MSRVRDWYKVTINAIREVSDMPLLIHDAFRHIEWDWLLTDFPYENVYMGAPTSSFLSSHSYHPFISAQIPTFTTLSIRMTLRPANPSAIRTR